MTQRLSLKGQRTCLDAAAAACGGLQHVRAFSFDGMQSGGWRMPPRISCNPGQPLFFSPYDPSMSGSLRRVKTHESTGIPVERSPDFAATGAMDKKGGVIAGCAKPITVKVCFGDCLCDPSALTECPRRGADESWAQVLGTSKPPGSRTITVCGDELAAQLGGAHMLSLSRDVLDYYCQDFAWRTIFSNRALGSTCAAYRGTVDCSALFGN
jgi:hypothetical protein